MSPLGLADSVYSYLMVSSILFVLGLFTIMTRRNALAVLMGVELILNAAALNFVVFSQFNQRAAAGLTDAIPAFVHGHVVAVFVVVFSAAEAVVAIAITIAVYRHFSGINVDTIDTMKG